jgi:hypothetical protein
MSSLDVGGFDEIARELRAARPGAPPSLREQVLALGEPAPRPVPRPRWSRRAVVVLASGAAVTAAAASLVVGLVQSGHDEPVATNWQARGQARGAAPTILHAERALKTKAQPAPAAADAGLPVTSSRVQRYEADLTLRVRDLSATTKRALRLTHRFGGYVRSVDYGSGERAGHADLVVRIPIRRVQEAILRFSSLGTILDQHVRVQDLQPSVDRRFRRMRAIRRQITALASDTSPEAQAKVARLRRQLVALQREQSQAVKRAEFATIALAVRTKEAEVVPASRPGRIERALDHAGTILVKELAVLVYVLVVALPLALVAAAAFMAARALRRRSLDRLLEQN